MKLVGDDVRRVAGHHIVGLLGNRDVDQVDAGTVCGQARQGRRPGERTSADDEDLAVLSLMGFLPSGGVVDQLSWANKAAGLERYADVLDDDLAGVLRRHARLHVGEGDGHVRSHRDVGKETGRNIDGDYGRARVVEAVDDGAIRLTHLLQRACAQQGIDHDIVLAVIDPDR